MFFFRQIEMNNEQSKYVNSHPRRYYADLEGVEYCLELAKNCKNISETTRNELELIVRAINYTDKEAAQNAIHVLADTLFALKQQSEGYHYPVPAALQEKADFENQMLHRLAETDEREKEKECETGKYPAREIRIDIDLPPLEEDYYSFLFSSLPEGGENLDTDYVKKEVAPFMHDFQKRLDNLNEDLRETILLARKLETLFHDLKKVVLNAVVGEKKAKSV